MSGYIPNHNMDPNVVGSSSFQQLWDYVPAADNEQIYAKPLVYTPNGGTEMVITASEMNNVRIHNAKTGAIIIQRQLNLPFLSADSNCNDISGYIGITGTPIIDPDTDIMYVMAKGYKDPTMGSGGTLNGVYRFYALRIPSLVDVPGFPVLVDGHPADNDPAKWFIGGIALQRPSLTMVSNFVVAGFGSHCGNWNYTGYLASISKTPGVGLVR